MMGNAMTGEPMPRERDDDEALRRAVNVWFGHPDDDKPVDAEFIERMRKARAILAAPPPPAADAVAGMPQPFSPEWYVRQYEVCGRALCRANGDDPDEVIADGGALLWQYVAYHADREFLTAPANSAATPPAPRDTGDVTPEMMADALNDAWNEFCTDTGDFPDCFKLTKGPRLWANFHDGNFAALVAQYLNAARVFAALTARAEGDA